MPLENRLENQYRGTLHEVSQSLEDCRGMWGGMCVYGREIDRWVGRTGRGGGSYNGSFEEFNLVLAMIAGLPGKGRIVEFRSFGAMPKTLMPAALAPERIFQ